MGQKIKRNHPDDPIRPRHNPYIAEDIPPSPMKRIKPVLGLVFILVCTLAFIWFYFR